MTEASVRRLAESDHAAWLELWRAYNAFYGREGATALDANVIDATWQRLLEQQEPVDGLVAELDGRTVGLCHFVFHRNTIQIADTCYLQDLFTESSARGKGVARQLIRGVMERCRERGVGDIYWHTHEDNRAARHLYDLVATDTRFTVYRLNDR